MELRLTKSLLLGVFFLINVKTWALDDEARVTTPFLEELQTEIFIPRSKLENVRGEVITAIERWTKLLDGRSELMGYEPSDIWTTYTQENLAGLGDYLEGLRTGIKYVKAVLRRQGLSGRRGSSGGSTPDVSDGLAFGAAEATIIIPTWQIEWAQSTMNLLLDEILLVPADHIVSLAQLKIIVRRLYDKKHTRPNVSETALNNVTSVLELFLAQLSATTS